MDERLHDTRLIWEAVQARLEKLEQDTATGFRNVEKRLDAISVLMNKLHGDLLDHEDHLSKLEQKPA